MNAPNLESPTPNPSPRSLRVVGHVWVVTERCIRTGASSIYGIFESERLARVDYGAADDAHEVHIACMPVWGK